MTSSAPPVSNLRNALRRFWWVVAVVTVITTVAAVWVGAFGPEQEYTAEAQYIVPVQTGLETAPSTRPSSAFDAGGLARTYAELLTSDMALTSELSLRSGISLEDLEDGLTAAVVPSTPVIDVSFSSTDESGALGFFPILTEALAEGVTPNIPAGNLVLLQSPQAAESTGSLAPYPVLGLIAGLILGIGAALLLERMDTRVRDAGDIRRMTEHPVLDLTREGDTADSVLAMRAMRLRHDIAQVAVVGIDAQTAATTSALCERLARAGDRLAEAPAAGDRPIRVDWQHSGVLVSDSAAELTVQRTDATVLVVAVGSRIRAAEDALVQLGLLGVSSAVVAVVPPARPHPVAPAGPRHAPAAKELNGRRPAHDLAPRS